MGREKRVTKGVKSECIDESSGQTMCEAATERMMETVGGMSSSKWS